MDFLEFSKSRYSCRSFKDKKIEKEKILKILEVAKIAPTAVNFQPQRILVLDNKDKLSHLNECTPYGWNAPLVFIVCYDKNISWKRKYDLKDEGIIDASIVTTHMMLEAHSLGLGTTWVGAFDPQKVREVYNIPNNYEIVAILPVGYPSEESKPSAMHSKRNEIEQFTFFNEIK